MHLPSITGILPLAALLSPRQTTINYEPYTPCAESCLEYAAFAAEKCPYTTEVAWVTCICNNDDEQASIARCIYTDCGPQTLNASAPINVHNCQINGSPSTLSEEQFIAYGEEAATTETPFLSTAIAAGTKTSSISTASAVPRVQQDPTSTLSDTTPLTTTFLPSALPPTTSAIPNSDATPTKASSSTPSASSASSSTNSSGSGLNTASLIGTIVASVTGAVGSCIGAWFAWKKYKKETGKKTADDGATSVVP